MAHTSSKTALGESAATKLHKMVTATERFPVWFYLCSFTCDHSFSWTLQVHRCQSSNPHWVRELEICWAGTQLSNSFFSLWFRLAEQEDSKASPTPAGERGCVFKEINKGKAQVRRIWHLGRLFFLKFLISVANW